MQTDILHLGIDVGASNTKVIALDRDKKIIHTLFLGHRDDATALMKRIPAQIAFDTSKIRSIALTGVGAYQMPETMFDVRLTRVHEFEATALGGTVLSGLSNALIVSMGTGTSFIHAKNGDYRHIIGSGIGGGTLLGLGEALSATQDMSALEALARKGVLSQVDLTVGEITADGHLGLDPDLTASNFGSVKPDAAAADLVLGAYNLVYQAVGTMSVLAAQGQGIEDVVVVGTLGTSSFAQEMFARFSRAYGIRYTIPPHAMFATAYGAVLTIAS